MDICLEGGTNDLHGPTDSTDTPSSLASFQIGLTSPVPAYSGYPGKKAVKWVSD